MKFDGCLIEVRMDEQFYRDDLEAVFLVTEAKTNDARITIHDALVRFFSEGAAK